MLEETENSPRPVIVGMTSRSDVTTFVGGTQSECKQAPPPWSNDHDQREQLKGKHLNAPLQ